LQTVLKWLSDVHHGLVLILVQSMTMTVMAVMAVMVTRTVLPILVIETMSMHQSSK
jgi:hypothetical protein